MSKKQLNVGAIANELEGASLFFPTKAADPASPISLTTQNPPPIPPAVTKTVKPKPPHPPVPPAILSPEPSNEQSNERTEQRTNEVTPTLSKIRTDDRTNDPPRPRYQARQKIRHSFDIFADQLLSLKELAIEQEKLFGERVLIGDLVQQAIDMLITKERNK